MKVKKYKRRLGWLSLILCNILLVGCDLPLLKPKGQIGLEQRSLILTTFSLILIVVVPVILLVIYFTYKYRETNKYADYRPNWSHSNKIEIIIWTIPITIILILSILAWNSTYYLEPSKKISNTGKSITIEVISMDWKWLFIYPEQGIAVINEIVFPVNTELEFKITSNSVMNSFFIPCLGSQIYAMAGMQSDLHLIANKSGTYEGISASYSGHGFSGMKFKAIAVPNQVIYNQWISKVKQSPHAISNMTTFEKLAAPSCYNQVEYFSNVKPDLFKAVVNKFTLEKKQHN